MHTIPLPDRPVKGHRYTSPATPFPPGNEAVMAIAGEKPCLEGCKLPDTGEKNNTPSIDNAGNWASLQS